MKCEDLMQQIREQLEELQAIDTVYLNVEGLTSVTDHMVICSGRSTRHVKAIGVTLVQNIKKHGVKPLSIDGLDTSEWVVVDFADIIVHIMLPQTRAYYNLESLWVIPDENTAA